MGKKKQNNEELKVVVAEFKVSMHCNACERTVARTISKVKGVDQFTTNMNTHKVVVTGRVDPQQVLKKLKKKTGKRVEIVGNKKEESSKVVVEDRNAAAKRLGDASLFGYCRESEVLTMFSDENPNACSII